MTLTVVNAVRTPFPCWACGGKTRPLAGTHARYCPSCEVMELRLREPYFPRVRCETTDPWGEPYLDHSLGHYPCP